MFEVVIEAMVDAVVVVDAEGRITLANSGAIGLTSDGLVEIRDANAVALADRNRLRKLVADENGDRNSLYREIATANGHAEWEADIRKTFAERWVANARAGWYHKSKAGEWSKK